MLTGKKVKITAEERREKIKAAQLQRDAYIAQNMGGFTRIYPLDTSDLQNQKLMEKYNYLISIEDELTDKRKDREIEKDDKDKVKKF